MSVEPIKNLYKTNKNAASNIDEVLKNVSKNIRLKPSEGEIKAFVRCLITRGDTGNLYKSMSEDMGIDSGYIERILQQARSIRDLLKMVKAIDGELLDFKAALRKLLANELTKILSIKSTIMTELARSITGPAMLAISGMRDLHCMQFMDRIMAEIVNGLETVMDQYLESILGQQKLDEAIFGRMGDLLNKSISIRNLERIIEMLDSIVSILETISRMLKITRMDIIDAAIDNSVKKLYNSFGKEESPPKYYDSAGAFFA